MSKLLPDTKVTILMDVDGVLNDFHDLANPALTTFDAENGFKIAYDKSILSRLLAWHDQGLATVKWLTTWCHDANKMLRREFGFADDLEVVGYDYFKAMPFTWWKLKAVDDYIHENQDEFVVWIDDELQHHPTAWEFAGNDPNILPVSPYPSLSHTDLDHIEEWITSDV